MLNGYYSPKHEIYWSVPVAASNATMVTIHTTISVSFSTINQAYAYALADYEQLVNTTGSFTNSIQPEYNITWLNCLSFTCSQYALSCALIFCMSCAYSTTYMMIFQGLKTAS